jgi:aspartate kinase
MNVLKFGGTSVGSAARMKEVAQIIKGNDSKIVVLSAVSGTTNKLVSIGQSLYQQLKEEALDKIYQLKKEYQLLIIELYQKKTVWS